MSKTVIEQAIEALDRTASEPGSDAWEREKEAMIALEKLAEQPAQQEPLMVDIHPPATQRDRWMYEQGRLAERDPRSHAPQAQPAQRTDDTKRLDALAKNSWDLRCFDMPTGADDADIGWRVIEHHMSKPNERTVAEVFRDDPRQAIDAAIEAAHNIKENQS